MKPSEIEKVKPKVSRIIVAFVVAPLVPCALLALEKLVDGRSNGSYLGAFNFYAMFGAYPAALLFGVPTLLALRNRLKPRLAYVTVAGGMVAAAPWVLIVFGSNPDFATIDGQITVQHGTKTLLGWVEAFKIVAMTFGLGLIGGLSFWIIAVFQPRHPRSARP